MPGGAGSAAAARGGLRARGAGTVDGRRQRVARVAAAGGDGIRLQAAAGLRRRHVQEQTSAPSCASSPYGQYIEDTDRFPGWRGELPRMEVGVGDTVGFGELGQVRVRWRLLLLECHSLVYHSNGRLYLLLECEVVCTFWLPLLCPAPCPKRGCPQAGVLHGAAPFALLSSVLPAPLAHTGCRLRPAGAVAGAGGAGVVEPPCLCVPQLSDGRGVRGTGAGVGRRLLF